MASNPPPPLHYEDSSGSLRVGTPTANPNAGTGSLPIVNTVDNLQALVDEMRA